MSDKDTFTPFFLNINAIMVYKSNNIDLPPHLQEFYDKLMIMIPKLKDLKIEQPVELKTDIYIDPAGDAIVEELSAASSTLLQSLHDNYWVDVSM